MFKLDYKYSKKGIKEIFRENDRYLSTEIVKAVMQAIDNGEDVCEVGEIIIGKDPEDVIEISSTRENYRHTLEANKENLIKYEDYELVILVNKYLDKLS